ncbi:probable 2-oxoglutarate-dependent dioxygenase AOP1.2 [Carica papaya]|uniref:probable 2-oxoglutarate-dependent dioxygenase AOP1.2 n=1 Tax=Carica papaya TaxID=3649 RepID=UPI000B8C75B8|nr:probable 2-oxoglutarate-dependent dioxygenase AOP1.2 [Carica papaya]
MAAASSKIPIIDFSVAGLEPGTSLWFSTCQQVCNALEEHGFFEAIYSHDMFLPNLHKKIFDVVKELYDLPTEIKKKNRSRPGRDYYSDNQLHEGMGIDSADTLQGVQNFTTLMWPNGNHQFSENAYKVTNIIKTLDQKVVRMVLDYYGTEKQYDSLIKSTNYTLREALIVWSNGKIRPAPHQVIANGDKERYSIGLFMFNEGVICVPDELVGHKTPLRYKPLDHPDYVKQVMYFAEKKMEYPVEEYCGI